MIISAEHIFTRFGLQQVHNDISFTIDSPSIVALIGGSGSGKSVLLRELLGLLRPQSGRIHILDQDISTLSPDALAQLRNRYGVLYQNGALFSALTVEENVAVPFHEHTNLTEEQIQSLVELRIFLSGLTTEVLQKMPSELSGGMRKRVALARALALEPEILFLDEPTSGLDPINARAFDSLIRSLCDNLGLTVFIITHDLDTIEGIADRVIVLGEGKLIADGSVAEVAKTPHPWIQSYFTARATCHIR